ncbi:MAG TPA: hypothetical protein VGH11_00345 [Jatrophihabitans sp.]|jgi:hypothetical protein
MTNQTQSVPPATLRRLDSANADTLADLFATFDDLQTVLRCCERLVSALTPGDSEPDDVLIEGLWTLALLSYTRCFSTGRAAAALTVDDLTTTQPDGDVLEWHQVLLQLREHYADLTANPRERFSVGIAQDPDGAAGGVGVTSARQPLVDSLTVRQTGAIAFALSEFVNERIAAQQQKVFTEAREIPNSELNSLDPLEVAVAQSGAGGDVATQMS